MLRNTAFIPGFASKFAYFSLILILPFTLSAQENSR